MTKRKDPGKEAAKYLDAMAKEKNQIQWAQIGNELRLMASVCLSVGDTITADEALSMLETKLTIIDSILGDMVGQRVDKGA